MRRLAPVLFVFVLAPVTAEYLIGYDDTLTNPAALIFGIVIFGPLYGAPAVLIRDVTRRRGLGWPTMLLLATAFGLVEAGLFDQSMFDPDYRDIPYWPLMREPTYLPGTGTSAYMALTFVAGHVFGSICAPIALAESWWPRRRREPWLGSFGLGVVSVLWLLAGWLILQDQLATSRSRISTGQLVGTLVVVLLLVVAALTRPRNPLLRTGNVPAPWLVGLVSAALLTVRSVVPTGWIGTMAAFGAIVLWLVLLGRWSRRTGWTPSHVLAAVVGDLLSIGGPAFTTTPLGDLDQAAKLVANTLLLALVLAVAWWGFVREAHWARVQPAASATV
jgi:hypothetical protein